MFNENKPPKRNWKEDEEENIFQHPWITPFSSMQIYKKKKYKKINVGVYLRT